MNSDKIVTLPLAEYEQLLDNVEKKDDALTQCIEEGKVLVKDKIVYTVFLNDYCLYDQFKELDINNHFRVMSLDNLNDAIDIEVMRVLSQLGSYHEKCEDIYNKCLEYKNSLESKNFWQRLVYLFTGKV